MRVDFGAVLEPSTRSRSQAAVERVRIVSTSVRVADANTERDEQGETCGTWILK